MGAGDIAPSDAGQPRRLFWTVVSILSPASTAKSSTAPWDGGDGEGMVSKLEGIVSKLELWFEPGAGSML